MKKAKIQAEVILIPEKISVFEDKRTQVRSVAFPIDFPDGNHGIITITRLSNFPWVPHDDIASLSINFKI